MWGDEADPGATEATFFNSTIANNAIHSTLSGPGCGSTSAGKCLMSGAAIWYKGLRASLRWVSIVGNTVFHTDGVPEAAGVLVSGQPASLLDLRSTVMARNKIIKQGQPPETHNLGLGLNFEEDSEGFNLFDDQPQQEFTLQTSDHPNTMTCFNPLANNGGPTRTLRPARCGDGTVAARDNGGPAAGISDDQRGEDRPVPTGGNTDVGAFECQSGECGQSLAPSAPPPGFGGDSTGGSKQMNENVDPEMSPNVTSNAPSSQPSLAGAFGEPVTARLLLTPDNPRSVWHDPLGIDLFGLLPTR
jgi:hypothetical protein